MCVCYFNLMLVHVLFHTFDTDLTVLWFPNACYFYSIAGIVICVAGKFAVCFFKLH